MMSRFQHLYQSAWAIKISLKQDFETETDPAIKDEIAKMTVSNDLTIARIIEGGKVAGQPIKQN